MEPVTAMRRVVMSLAFALVAAGAVSFSVIPSAAPRAKGADSVFLLPATDGYGIAECLTGERECGKIVANAWCEAKGFTKAASYGAVSPADVTGSVTGRNETAKEPPLMITCAD
jgi:hypothetical protein